MKTKILLVEDEESLREMITLNLEMEDYDVETAVDGREGLEKFFERKFDLAILDVMLPEIDGFNLCRLIRNHDKKTPIFFLTAKNTSLDKIEGLKLGADEYMTKPFNLEEFLLRVNNLLRRSNPQLGEDITEIDFGKNKLDFKSMKASNYRGEELSFSKREFEFLKLLVSKQGEVVSREEVIDRIWEKDANPSPRTIDNFMVNFRKSFERNPKEPSYFQSIRGVGYRFDYKTS